MSPTLALVLGQEAFGTLEPKQDNEVHTLKIKSRSPGSAAQLGSEGRFSACDARERGRERELKHSLWRLFTGFFHVYKSTWLQVKSLETGGSAYVLFVRHLLCAALIWIKTRVIS